MKYFCGLFIVLIFCSCKYIIQKKYGFNSKQLFGSKIEYAVFVTKQLNVPDSLLYYLDTATFLSFTQTLSPNMAIYYGSFINDSTQIEKPVALRSNESCKGNIGKELKRVSNLQQHNLKHNTSVNLTKFRFHSVKYPNTVQRITGDNKYTVILLYSRSLGSYYDDLYNEIVSAYNNNKTLFDLKIITLDQLAYLK